ncbi:hypothetical protein WA026_007731 [Henosepilachna vigintioctopunctata]|uniref:Uncharacterized protein n=1 Tax=Henosepilachna vigintioctopunctata TaxID=420089 RepID=A0AAW1TYJ6_9CUCU
MKVLPDPDKLGVLLEHIDDKFLDDLIQGEKSPEKLSCYLKWKYDRINRKLSERQDFAIKKLFDSKECTPHLKKMILKWSLLIQNTNDEFISCIKCFNEELKNLRLGEKVKLCGGLEELFNIAEVILIVNKERELEIVIHVDKENLKTLLLELTNMKLNSEYHINVPSLFLSYFDEIFISDPEIVDSVVFFLIEQENLDFLSIIFDKRLSVLVKSGCFQTNCLWNLLKNCISDENSIKRKQALYILSSTIEFLKNNDSNLRPEVLKSNSPDDWNIYFILLHLSREKQLHLIKPTLKLLESVAHLHIYWRSCLYKILLNHSQLFVVYKTVEYLMDLPVNKTDNLLFVLKNVMNALNKYEYSDLSLNAYSKFGIFCNTLPSEYLVQVFEEFISLEWNPIGAWCFLSSISSVLHKVPQRCISDILHKLKSLPHTFMRNSCIYTFLQNLFKNRENNIIGDLLEIGSILLFEDTYIHRNLFKNVVKMNKRKLEEKKSLLLENLIDLIDKNNEKKIHIYLEIMEILQLPLDSSINIPCSVIGDILLLHFPESKNIKHVLDFLLLRFECDDGCEFHYLSKYLDNLFLNQGDVKEMTVYTEKFNEKVDKLWDISRNNISKTLIAMKFISRTDYSDNVKQMMKLERHTEYYENVITHSHKFWIKHTLKYSLKSNHYDNYIILMEKLKDLLDFEIEHSVHLVVESLEVLLNCCTTNERIVESLFIYEKCLKKICKLPSATLRSYSVVFFRSIFCLELFSNTEFVECWKRWVAEYFEDYFFESEIVMKVILEGCHKLICLEAPTVDIFIPLILRGLLCGLIVQKKQRVEYGICQEIHRINNKFLDNQNPNIISMNIKMLSIESLYLLAKYHHGNISRLIVTMLLNLYKGHYKTRYFPDSKIHFEKLRIVQALLLVGPCSNESQDELITFIFNSFYEESHQASVKRLLQWLLIILILSDPFKHLEVMIEKLNISSLSHPSFLVALIPVVYHVILVLNSEKVWFQVSEIFLPLAMGANFKLRVYSQVCTSRCQPQ